MPGLVELAYTTAGGLIGATAQNYLAKHQERRQARAAVLERVRQVEDTIEDVRALVKESGLRAPRSEFPIPLGLEANLADGTESRRALAKTFGGLEAAALIAGVLRDIVDLYRRIATAALDARVIWLMASYSVPSGDRKMEELVYDAGDLHLRAVALLSSALWHPWRFRLRIRSRLQALETSLYAFQKRCQFESSRQRHPSRAGALEQALGLRPRLDGPSAGDGA